MIDNLKAVCTNYGLGNTGNEYKISTETCLYKFLNDKFFYELKKTVPAFKSKTTIELEKLLANMPDEQFDSQTLYLSAHTAIIKPTQFISYLFNRHAKPDFHKTFDNTLNKISEENEDIFSVKAGEGASVKLFEPLSNYVVQPEKRDTFCSAIITKLTDVSFEELFRQKYDFFAEIFEYLIKDYNKDFGKYAEYYTPHSIARIIAKILVAGDVRNVRIYDPAAGSGTLLLALAHEIGENNCTLYTQDISQKSNEFLRLNLILNNLVHSLPNVVQDDTLLNPRHLNSRQNAIATFDYIVSNPPFKMDFSETRDTLAGDNYRARFFAGVPNTPPKDTDKMPIYLLFLQHIIKSLNEHGKAAVVVPTGFLTASARSNKIAFRIRQHIVSKKILRGVISMPSNIFANTGTNVSVVFLDANGSDKALLVDASNLGTKQKIKDTKNQRTYLSDGEINLIIDTFNHCQEIEDFSVLVSLDEIEQKNFSFSAGQYFKVKIEYVDLSPEEFRQKICNFQSDLQKFFDEGHRLEGDIIKQLKTLTYEKN